MNRADAEDAAPIVLRLLQRLAACIPAAGEAGSRARIALSDTAVNIAILLGGDELGPPLLNCFQLVQNAGATLRQFEEVRGFTEAETPQRVGGVIVQNSAILLCLATEAEIIAVMTFTSSQDVDALLLSIQGPFGDAEETAADEMDQASYQALIALHAAVSNHLITTARPLPRRIPFQFAAPLPSLVLAHRLYADPGRADEIVAENKIVHPLFCPPRGVALSS
jgi:hypothetical protein